MLVFFILELERSVEFAQGFLLVTPDDLVTMGGNDGGDGRVGSKVGADAVLGGIAQFVGDVNTTEVDVARRGVVELYPIGLLLEVVDVDAIVGRDFVDDHGREF